MVQGASALKGRKDSCQVPRFGAEDLGRLSPEQGPAMGRERDQRVPESLSRPQRTPAADFLLCGEELSPALSHSPSVFLPEKAEVVQNKQKMFRELNYHFSRL